MLFLHPYSQCSIVSGIVFSSSSSSSSSSCSSCSCLQYNAKMEEEETRKERLSEENNHHKIAPTLAHMVCLLACLLWLSEDDDEGKENTQTKWNKNTQSACWTSWNTARELLREKKENEKEKYFVEATDWRQQAKLSGNDVQVLALAGPERVKEKNERRTSW